MARRALLVVTASGFSALGLQIVWTQQTALALGHEAAAVLAVVAAFFGGLSMGAFALGARIARSAQPGRAYAICEAIVGAWALVLVLLMKPATLLLSAFLPIDAAAPAQWACVFGGTFLLLLPATAAMGATLPALERVFGPAQPRETVIPHLYACNTLGAVLGAVGAAFALVPALGLNATALICGATNLVCAVAAWRLFPPAVAQTAAPAAQPGARPFMLLAATGLLGIGYEVLVVRALSQVAENTVYTFAILLAVYLIGTTLGAAAYARRASGDPRMLDGLLRGLAAACVVGILVLAAATRLKAAFAPASMPAALVVEAVLALGAFLAPTLVMGALFSHLATAAGGARSGFARGLGVNTLGAALAPIVFGLVSMSTLGPKLALLSVVVGYLLLTRAAAWRQPIQWALAASVALLAVFLPGSHVDVPDGGHVARLLEGPLATVSIVEDARGITTLHIDNKQQEGSSATVFADARQGLLPVLLHPEPHRALFLGLGTGVTARAASLEPGLRVDAVELLPEVVDASRSFADALPSDTPPRLLVADARRFVRYSRDEYDVIVADNFHPARSGSGALYTVEHFAAVRGRLSADGVFCQWLPLHQLDLQTLRSIVRSFVAVNPHALALLATNSLDTPVLGLVARRDDAPFDAVALRSRVAVDPVAARFGIADDFALLGSFVAGPISLADFAGDAPLNTDDHPVVTYSAPRITYAPDSTPRDRLFALIHQVGVAPAELVTHTPGTDYERRLADYWVARNRYLEAGRDVQPSPDVRRMLAQVREPLLDVLKVSPDFRPAYDPLLEMARALAAEDIPGARSLLEQLAAANPERPEAPRILNELASYAPAPRS